jgi:hypothetical protein
MSYNLELFLARLAIVIICSGVLLVISVLWNAPKITK